jgi:hypothetical protein
MGLSLIKSESCIDADQYFKIVRYIIPFREDRICGDELQHKFIKMYGTYKNLLLLVSPVKTVRP